MGARLEALRRQHTEVSDGINTIEAKASAEGRDLTDAEQTDVDALYARAATLKPDIEAEAEKQGSLDAAAAVLAKIKPAGPMLVRSSRLVETADAEPMAIGEYLSLVIRAKAHEKGYSFGDANAAELLTRAVATQKLADNPSIVPKEIIGPILKLADDSRPVFNSMTQRPMPEKGSTFSRPKITQRVLVAEQAAELDELASRKMTLTQADVSKRTFAGTLELSQQDLDWTDPSILQIVIDDFAGVYGSVTEAAAVTALTTLASATSPWTTTNIGTMISSFTTGIQANYTASKRMPDTVWLSLDQMLSLAGNTNSTTNVSALSLIKQALSDAGTPMKFVVAPTLPSGTRILGSSNLVEAYEKRHGLLSAPDVTHLGAFVSYYGYVAFFGDAAGFTKLFT